MHAHKIGFGRGDFVDHRLSAMRGVDKKPMGYRNSTLFDGRKKISFHRFDCHQKMDFRRRRDKKVQYNTHDFKNASYA